MKFRYIYACITVLTTLFASACSDKWDEEQYEQYVSFKSPTDNSTVTRIQVKYKNDAINYKLPLLVSGTTMNTQNLEVNIGVDSDTLQIYNHEHFGDRKDQYYQEMNPSRYLFNPVTTIPAGEVSALVNIQLDFRGLDLSDNWVLPLIVKDDPSFNYKSNPRLGYNNALLWFTPFNDYSGSYGTSALNVRVQGNDNQKLYLSGRNAYVVDENSIFFYAGAVNENREDRKFFKIKATFVETPDYEPKTNESGVTTIMEGTINLEAMNNMQGMNFTCIGTPTYIVTEKMELERPMMMQRLITIRGLDYIFTDPKEVSGTPVVYTVKGSMTLQRNINTSIDDEELAIEW